MRKIFSILFALTLVLSFSLVAVPVVEASPADGDVTIVVQDQAGNPIAGATATLLFYGGGKGGYSMGGKSTDGTGSATFTAAEIATWLTANSYDPSSQIYVQPGAKVETGGAYGKVRTVDPATGFPCIPYNTPGAPLAPKPAMSFTYNMIMMSTVPVQTVWNDPTDSFTVTATMAESLSVTPDVTRMRLIRNLVPPQPPATGGSDDDWYMWNGTGYERWKGIATVGATAGGTSVSASFSQGIFSDWLVGNKIVVRPEFGVNRIVDSVSCIDDYNAVDILRPSSYIHPAQINDTDLFYPTIQDAIDAATGTTIKVAAGTYTEQVTIGKSLNLIGAGEGITTIQAPTSGRSTVSQPNPGYSDIVWDYVVAAYPSSGTIDVKIQGFTVDANVQNGSSTQNFAGVFLRDIGDGTDDGLYSCTVNNFGSYGVSSNYWSGTYGTWMGNYGVIIYDDSELTIDDCDIDDYSVSGISAKGTDVDLTITSNDLDGTDSNYVGLFLRDGVATITDNNIYNHDGVGENMGIYLYDAANGIIIDDSVGANTIADNYIGLFLKGTSGATIDGNTFTNNLLRSIVIQEDSDNNAVTGNTITMVTGTVDAGIVIGSDSGGNVIGGDTPADGNSITLPTDGGGPRYCIWLSAVDTGDVTIKNNTINGGQRAVQFDGGPGHSGTNTVSDNTISGSVFGGIMSNCHGDFVISGNTISGTDRPLEFWQAGNGNIVITLNTLSSTAYDAINAGSYASMNISYNNLECLAGGWGVNNRMTTQIDARYNWWGDASGPSGGATDPVTATIATGSGEVVGTSPYVRFDPWTGKTASVSTTTGTGTASFTSSAGAVENVTAVATPPGAPVLPDGVFSFKVTGLTSGQTITITIVLPGPVLPVGSAKWWKYQAGAWYSLPIGSDDGDNIITITLTDGVFPGDEDSIAGQITDPGGLGYLVSACRLDISSTEGGSVTTPGEGTYTRYCGTGVSLVATAATGYHFVNWTGDVGTIADVHDASTTITMWGWYSITANFESGGNPQAQGEYTLTISSTAGGSVTSPGEGNSAYEAGTMVNLVASPDDGYEFVDWTGDGITNPDSATTTVTMNGDYSIKASFDFEETTSANPAEGSSGSLGCFIATAAYGTPTTEQIDVLREFRDVVLLESTAGSQFIALYYQLSPPIADFIAGSSFLRTLVRELLVDPVVWVVEATGAIWRN